MPQTSRAPNHEWVHTLQRHGYMVKGGKSWAQASPKEKERVRKAYHEHIEFEQGVKDTLKKGAARLAKKTKPRKNKKVETKSRQLSPKSKGSASMDIEPQSRQMSPLSKSANKASAKGEIKHSASMKIKPKTKPFEYGVLPTNFSASFVPSSVGATPNHIKRAREEYGTIPVYGMLPDEIWKSKSGASYKSKSPVYGQFPTGRGMSKSGKTPQDDTYGKLPTGVGMSPGYSKIDTAYKKK